MVFKSLETFLNRFNFPNLMRRKIKLLEILRMVFKSLETFLNRFNFIQMKALQLYYDMVPFI